MKKMHWIFRALSVGLYVLSCEHEPANAQEPAKLPRSTSTAVEVRPLCKYVEGDVPSWYQVENSMLTICAIPPGREQELTGRVAGLLTFRVESKEGYAGQSVEPIAFSRKYFGPLFSMFLNENHFIATGCIGSHADYLYIAKPERPDQGIGITCVSPLISPSGQYIFFRAPSSRSAPPPPAPCCCILDLAEETLSAYRVFPLEGETSEKFHLVLTEPGENWYWPPDEFMFNCQDSQGQAHTAKSGSVWSPDSLKIAFVDRVVGGTSDFHVTHQLVLLDFTTGIQTPGCRSFPMNYRAISTSGADIRSEAVDIALIEWLDDATLKVVFSISEPKLLKNAAFLFSITPNSLMPDSNLEFFDLANAVD